MKKLLSLFLFLIIPALLLIISYTLIDYQGPYFSGHQYDPNYAYLISSLNLSQMAGYGVAHIDHPGTPVQVIGAIVIKLSCYFGGHVNIAEEVLSNPEKYISEIDHTFAVINFFGIFLLGVIAYKVYSSVAVSLLLQLAPFTSINILAWLSIVSPEIFLVFVSSIFISVLILFLKLKESDVNSKKYLLYVITLSGIIGLGIATKLTFFPLAIIPFILIRGMKYKLVYLLLILVSFLIFVIPAISFENVRTFTDWVYNIFVHTGKYGSGKSSIVDPISFLKGIRSTFLKEWFFDLTYFSVCLSLFIYIFPKLKKVFAKKSKSEIAAPGNGFADDTKFRLILGIFFSMSLQIIIVAKHYKPNYMFPALIISAFAVFSSVSILSDYFSKKLTPGKKNLVYIVLICVILAYGVTTSYRFGNIIKNRRDEAVKLINYTDENYKNSVKVFYSYPPTGQEFALMFGINYAASQQKNYNAFLNSKYPNSIFYYKTFSSFSEDSTNIEKIFKSSDKIILFCWEESQADTFMEILKKDYGIINASAKKKFSNRNNEFVYEIVKN